MFLVSFVLLFGYLVTWSDAGVIDLAQDAKDAASLPLVTGFFRLEAHILRLENPSGISHTGLPCDITDACDPKITGIIDTEKPNHDFGGDSAPYRNWEVLFDGNQINSPEINKIMTRDSCGKGIRKINVRVRAMDKDAINDDKIDNFSCYVSGATGMPAANINEAKWSQEHACVGQDKSSIKVFFKYRWYNIPEAECKQIHTGGIPLIDGMFS